MTINSDDESVVTNDHLLAFGGIIHAFARIDGLIQIVTAAVSETDLSTIVVLMRELGYSAKRDTLYSYMALAGTKAEYQQPIKDLLGEAHKYNGLRNNIAHSYWVAGKRPGSIKPASIKIRGGKGEVIGQDDSEKDYLPRELGAIADKLRVIHNSLLRFLRAENLIVDL